MSNKLFQPATLGNITLSNHIAMAPMTRSRAINNIPNELIATYYAQRASAGLIITEGVAPSANGLGYARIPGVFSAEQIEGWKLTTQAVHAKGGKLFMQLMHTGRASHPLNMQAGTRILAPSAIRLDGQIYTDQAGMQDYPTPEAMTLADIEATKQEYVQAAQNAIAAGFDGIELHAANGYLLEQFLAPNTNVRTDEYGGSIENRSRFVLEVARAVAAAIGKEKVGIRFSPYGVFNGIEPYSEEQAEYLAQAMNQLGLVYLHLVDHSAMGAPAVSPSVVQKIRQAYKGTLMLSGGYDVERAEKDLQSGAADLIAIGRPFIANPDLVERLQSNAPLAQPDFNTFYTPFAEGFTDYPTLATVTQ